MNEVAFQFLRDAREKAGHSNPPLGQMLLEDGAITVAQLLKALSKHKRLKVPLGQVLVSEGMLSQSRLYDTLARQWDLPRADLRHVAPTQLPSLGAEFCLEHTAFPEGFDKGILKLAVSDRTAFEKAADALCWSGGAQHRQPKRDLACNKPQFSAGISPDRVGKTAHAGQLPRIS